jgi:hypothetical protein
MRVNHNDYPELIRHSRLAYERYEKEPKVFQEVIRATRDGYILDAYNRGQTYVETNNRITFFAYAIRGVYPNARYIHLVRHPGNFVRSGLRRGWYNRQRHDVGRIRHTDSEQWAEMSDIEKIAWLWNETNQYVEGFLSTLKSGQFLQIRAEDMWSDVEVSVEICEFVGAKVSHRNIALMLERKVNRQRIGSMPAYEQWDREQKSDLRQYISLNEVYGYEV